MKSEDTEKGEIIPAYHRGLGFMHSIHFPSAITKAPGFYLEVIKDGLHMFGMEEDRGFTPSVEYKLS